MYNLKSPYTIYYFLALLILFASPLSSYSAFRLTFSKQQTLHKKDKFYRHKIQEGEWVSTILKFYGYEQTDLPVLLPRVDALNPHIRDLNKIRPGQTLNIPRENASSVKLKYQTNTSMDQEEAKLWAKEKRQVSHEVKQGDHVAKLLREIAKLPDDLIFNEYINIFKQLNPDLEDINNLEVGQKVIIPLPSLNNKKISIKSDFPNTLDSGSKKNATLNLAPANPSSFSQNKPDSVNKTKTSEPEQSSSSQAYKDIDRENTSSSFENKNLLTKNKDLCLAILSRIGFDFIKNRELIYPLASGRWLHLNLQKTPLARTPSGTMILFMPERVEDKINAALLTETDFKVCNIPDNWELQAVFHSIESISNPRIISWSKDHSLILSTENETVELQADYILITRYNTRRRVFLFNLNNPWDVDAPNLLQGFLNQKDIKLFFKNNSKAGGLFKEPNWPDQEDLYLPGLNAAKAWPEIRRFLGQQASGISPVSSDFKDISPFLKDLELLKEEHITLSLFANSPKKISIRVPVLSLQAKPEKVLIFPEKTSPYLLHLFILKGYNCLLLTND